MNALSGAGLRLYPSRGLERATIISARLALLSRGAPRAAQTVLLLADMRSKGGEVVTKTKCGLIGMVLGMGLSAWVPPLGAASNALTHRCAKSTSVAEFDQPVTGDDSEGTQLVGTRCGGPASWGTWDGGVCDGADHERC